MNTSKLLVQSLEQEGISYVFGVPGEENLDVLDAIRQSESIRFIVTRHEQAAGFMAATVGRLTGTPGVALATLGPGATNLVTAAAYAQLGAMPMLMITGQKPIRESKQGAFQIVDIISMMKPLTKKSSQLVEGALVASTVREAVRLASEERPGATHIEIPEDIATEEIDAKPLTISSVRRPVAEEKSISQAVEILNSAKRPILVIGAGANRKRTCRALTDIVEGLNIPFVNTQMGKGVVSEALPQFAGTAALSDNDHVHHTLDKADVIVNIGHDIVEKPPFIMNRSRQVIHINFESAAVNDIYNPQTEVIGDIANAVGRIHEGLSAKEGMLDWENDFHLPAKKDLDHSFSSYLKNGTTVTPHVLVDTLRNGLEDSAIVALDNGMYKIWFARHFKTLQPNTLLLDNALATMGAGLPSAMAAKLVDSSRQVVAVVGDGGFMMNSQELETAIRLNLDLVVLVLNDSSYQMIRWKQSNQGLDDWGLEFNNPDFVAYGRSYGANATSVQTPKELKESLKSALDHGGVHLIDVRFDYSNNSEALQVK